MTPLCFFFKRGYYKLRRRHCGFSSTTLLGSEAGGEFLSEVPFVVVSVVVGASEDGAALIPSSSKSSSLIP